MKRWTIRRLIITSFGVILALMIGTTAIAYLQLSEAARQTVESLRQSNLAIDELKQVSLGPRNGVSRFTLQVA